MKIKTERYFKERTPYDVTIALRVPILGAIEAISVFEVLANFKKSLVYVKTESRLKPLFCTLRSVIFFRPSILCNKNVEPQIQNAASKVDKNIFAGKISS